MKSSRYSRLSKEQLAELLTVGSSDHHDADRTVALPPEDDGATPDRTSAWPRVPGYRILEEISSGLMGSVFRAVQMGPDRHVALKLLTTEQLLSQRQRLRFEREVELTARLEHPNIARVYDSGFDGNVCYYAMELLDGAELDAYVQHQCLSVRRVVQLFLTICDGVQHAHQNGVIHRDLKPANVLVTRDGQPHVLDFGLAKPFLDADKGATISVNGEIAGTPAYMAPEQARGDIDAIDTRTDVYSLGVILYQLLTSRRPHESESNLELLRCVVTEEPPRPRAIVPGLAADLEAIVLKALAKQPRARYQSVAELAGDLQRWLDQLPVSAQPITTLYLLKKLVMRHRYASAVVALILLIVVSTSFIASYSLLQMRRVNQDTLQRQEAYRNDAALYRVVANQSLFLLFLERWHSGHEGDLSQIVHQLGPDSRERALARFLLTPEPMDRQTARLSEELGSQQAAFASFALAELHRKNEKTTAAQEHYRQFLRNSNPSDSCRWYCSRAESFLGIQPIGQGCPVLPSKD